MKEIIETASKLAPFLPLAKPLIEAIIKPKLDSLKEWLKSRDIDKQVQDFHLYESQFENYLCRTLERCSVLSTLVFPNQQIYIEKLYQPLTIINNGQLNFNHLKIEKFPDELFDEYHKILICDSAGMGKSTLSRFITIQAIKEKKGIPVFIELRKLNSKNTIIDEFLKQLNSIDHVFDKSFLFKLLSLGEFIIILDGYDEIVNEEQEIVTTDIHDFVFKCSNNRFLLTSRPEGSIATFGDFMNTNIQGLAQDEAFELLKKYDVISSSNLSVSLISEIEGVNNQVNEFLVNPFLVSLLYKTYSFKRDIPSKKCTFYSDVYAALYQDHDLSKDSYKRDKFSKLDIHDFRLVLREFAILTSKKREIEYTKSLAIHYIKDCKNILQNIDFKEASFVQDLLSTVPLFTTEGSNIKWAHKSLQDFFAAEYLVFQPQKDKLINHIIINNFDKYRNIIDLVIELDPMLIRLYVLPSILEGLIAHCDSKYLYKGIPENELHLRRVLTFGSRYWVKKTKKDGLKNHFSLMEKEINDECGLPLHSLVRHNFDIMVGSHFTNQFKFIQLLGKKSFLKGEFQDFIRSNFPDIKFLKVKAQEIVDDPSQKYNSKKLFSSFNDLILYSSRSNKDRFFIPDIVECKMIVKKAKAELENLSNEESLESF